MLYKKPLSKFEWLKNLKGCDKIKKHAEMAELADALDSKSSEPERFVWVQFPLSAPKAVLKTAFNLSSEVVKLFGNVNIL